MALAVVAPVVSDHWRVLPARTKSVMGRGLMELEKGEKTINLSSADLGNPGTLLFAEAMIQQSGFLRTLNLGGNRIGDEGAVQLAEAWQQHPNLQVFCLSYNRIGDTGAMHLGRALEKHAGIRLFNIEGNCISDTGASHLIGALSTNPRGAQITCSIANNPVKRLKSQAMENLALSAVTVKALAERGVKLGQLLQLYATGLADGTIDPERTTTGDVVLDIVVPQSSKTRQSMVEAFWATNPSPIAHVVHAWGGLFRDLVRAVAIHVTGEANPSLDLADALWKFDHAGYKEKSYFIDAFCVNQHATINSLRKYGLSDDCAYEVGSSGCQIDKFNHVAEQIQQRGGRRLVVVDVENLVLGRVLCLNEVHQSIGGGPCSDMVFCRLPSYPYDKMFTPVEDAKAACDADKDSILEDIRDSPGGYEQFNREIVEFVTSRIDTRVKEKIVALMPKEYE